jgi:hypothetical protein
MTRLRLPPAALPLLAALAVAGPARAADPVGVDACRQCHPKAVAIWEAGPHARAERGLGTRQHEPACLVCHAPLREAKQVGVGCEACHGAGEHYAKSYVMRDPELARAVGLVMPGEKECRACHDPQSPSLAPFDFTRAAKLVEHGAADRAARKAKVEGRPVPASKPPAPTPRPPAKLDRPAKGTAR